MHFEPSVLLAGAAALVMAGLVTNVAVPLVASVALAVRAVDYPGGRKEHSGGVPRLGGLAILAGLVLGGGTVAAVLWPSHGQAVARSELAGMVLATAIVFLTGLVEDVLGIGALKRFVAELMAAAVMVALGWHFSVLGLPGGITLQLGFWGKLVSVVWIVGVTNAINLLDGLDGLASGVVAIIAGTLAVLSLRQENVFSVVLLAAMAGACLGFLRHNWAPARVFMGDAGSLSLGFLLGVITVHSSQKSAAAVAILVPILALGVPVIDTLLVMLTRFVEGAGEGLNRRLLRVFRADRKHLHYLLQAMARRRAQVVLGIYLLVALSCAAALLVAFTRSTAAGLGLVAVEVAAVALIRGVGFARQARLVSERRREEARRALFEPGGGSGGS